MPNKPPFTVIIPARFAASRLPGKPLLDLAGKPVLCHVIDRALESGASKVIVATDDARIESTATEAGAQAIMTRSTHQSGTDRIAEVVQKLKLPDDEIIINVQGDEPDMPPELILQMAEALSQNSSAALCTACTPILDAKELNDINVVKVVRDHADMALYFSRAAIAFCRDQPKTMHPKFNYRRHLGIYAYRAAYVTAFSARPQCTLEETEKLEQLRALFQGDKIYCPDAIKAPSIGIDTQADIARARKEWAKKHS